MLEGIEVLCHSSIKISKEKIIYIDPFRIKQSYNDADLIFITHDHYDHYSEEDIDKIKKDDTIIIIPKGLVSKVLQKGFEKENIIEVKTKESYTVGNIKFETVPAYNINKAFHPKENNWLGYIIELNDIRYYIAGDTDVTIDNKKVKCDVAFIPVGGTYTTDYKEAAELVNQIKPKVVVPTLYGELVGTKKDAVKFMELLNSSITCEILIK